MAVKQATSTARSKILFTIYQSNHADDSIKILAARVSTEIATLLLIPESLIVHGVALSVLLEVMLCMSCRIPHPRRKYNTPLLPP